MSRYQHLHGLTSLSVLPLVHHFLLDKVRIRGELRLSNFYIASYQHFTAPQTKPNLTLIEFLNHRNFLIEKYAKIPKYIIPKQFHLVLHPRFDELRSNTTRDLEEFSYSGFIYVTVVSKKSSNKRIELNSKNLKISADDVSVYRSLTWSSIDFDDDPDWNSREIKYIVVQRNKRDLSEMEYNSNETIDEANNAAEVLDSDEAPEASEFSYNETLQIRNKTYFYPKFVSKCFASSLII